VVRILVAEDMRILRDTLVALLRLEDDLDVVAEVTDGQAIVPAAMASQPDVAVVDIDLPGTDGLTAAAELHERCPGCRVLILTVLGKPGNLRRALAAHVAGFLPKDTPAAELVDAVRKVAAGERVIDPQLALKALAQLPGLGGHQAWGAQPGGRGPNRRRDRLAIGGLRGGWPAVTALKALDVRTAWSGWCSSHTGVVPPASYVIAACRRDWAGWMAHRFRRHRPGTSRRAA
jgi:DNA-binding NarL/FixJ family response regulator